MRTRRATQTEMRVLRRALARWRGPTLPNGHPPRSKANPAAFDPEQLAIGTTVELEHTRRPEVALQIAMVHLLERDDYYARLERYVEGPRRASRDAKKPKRRRFDVTYEENGEPRSFLVMAPTLAEARAEADRRMGFKRYKIRARARRRA